MLKSIHPVLLACAIGCPALWCADAADGEKKLVEKDVPAAVLKTMHTAAAEAKLGGFESETKDGKPVFTATFHDKTGVEQEVTVAPDGKLISVAKEEDDADNDDGKGEKGEKKHGEKKHGEK